MSRYYLFIVIFFLFNKAFCQTTIYTENFSTTSLTTSYTTSGFTTSIGNWLPGGGGCGISSVAINGTTLKLKTGVNSSATTPVLRGVASIQYTAKTIGANSTLILTDGNSTFTNTTPITLTAASSGLISVPSSSNGVFTFSYPFTTGVTGQYIDDVVFTFNKPLTQATALTSSNVTSAGMTLNWTRPNSGNDNQGCIVFVGPSSTQFINPTDGTSYSASSSFGSGGQINNSGYYCVYNGSGTSVSVTGLNAGINYSVYVLEYNGIIGQQDENYNCITPAVYPAIPSISVSTNTIPLTDFSANFNISSISQSFTFSGNLLSNPIVVSAPSNFEISNNSNSGFTNSLTYNATIGTIASTTVYVRLKSGLAAANYSQNITLSSIGAYSQNVVCNGVVYSSNPNILTPSIVQLNGFNYAFGAGPSIEQAFTITASKLIDKLVVTAPADYEISFTSGSGYLLGNNNLLIPPTNGEVSAALVFVRLKSGLSINNYNLENLSITTLGGNSQNIVFNGSVTSSLIVSQQPIDTTICEGGSTYFSAASTTNSLINWQRSTDGIYWENITSSSLDLGVSYSGFTSGVLTLSNCSSSINFYKYRAVFTNSISLSATLTVTANNVSGTISGPLTLCLGTNGNFSITNNNPNPISINPNNFLTPTFSSVTVTSDMAYGPSSGSFHLVDIYRPTGDTNTNRPAVMFLHGGGFQVGNTKTQSYVVAICTYLAKCGYVAFAPNYNVGGGHTFAQNLAAVKDADLCLNWIRANGATYGYNPDYLFEGGGSAGAHLSCNLMFSDNGPNYGGYTVNLSNVIAFADCWGSSPNADRLYNFSSLNSNSIPCYIVQGDSDTTVPVQESITLNNYLNTASANHQFWEIPGETHGCPNHISQICDQIAHFFNAAWNQYTGSSNPVSITGGAWSSSNTSIATVNSSTGVVTPIASGTANIMYSITSTCGSPIVFSQLLTVCSLANNQFEKNSFSIIPNPTSGFFNIKGAFESVEIYTLTGQMVKNFKASEKNNLSISDLNIGLYLVKVFDKDNNLVTLKLIKE